MNIELSVIIVNYNGLKYLEGCFNSLREKLTGIGNEIIVLDNNSTDGSCSFIKNYYQDITLIESKINHGFGKGNNEAVKFANGEYLLLINNDTIVLSALEPVLNFLKNNKKIGVIGINMLNAENEYIPAVGNFPNIRNMFQLKKLLKTGIEFNSGFFSHNHFEVDWLSGSFLMLPKTIYQEINGFDEKYFMYVEDVDFCKKIHDLGYKNIFLPHFSYIHFVGFNTGKNLLLISGFEIYIEKYFSGYKKKLVLLALKTNKFVKITKNILNLK